VAIGSTRSLLFWFCLVCGTAAAGPAWVVEPHPPGPDLPPQGRSLFDRLTLHNGEQQVPFPLQALLDQIAGQLDTDLAYLDQPLKAVLIPLGRSLQREAAAPNYFASPRAVIAVDTDPAVRPGEAGLLLRDRLFIGYLETANILEVISYNEDAGRFEFQIVHDYRAGGKAQVRYARRVVCLACHQNAAPLFARPLWDETNANPDIAAALDSIGGDFYGLHTKIGVDLAYAIDNATDRANDFALTQLLWSQGCGLGQPGTDCRSALLTRALHYALSGERSFEHDSDDYRQKLRAPMQEIRATLWPQGLWLPNPDVPNRKPLSQVSLAAAARPDLASIDLTARANVTATFEPLEPRPPLALWNPEPDAWVERAIIGLRQFLATSDIQRLDQALQSSAAKLEHIAADCIATRLPGESFTRIKLNCQGPNVRLLGRLRLAQADGSISGRLRELQVRGQTLSGVRLRGQATANGAWQAELYRPSSALRVRLANGDALDGLQLRPAESTDGRSQVRLRIKHDAATLTAAAQQLRNSPTQVLTNKPFSRTRLLPPLFAALKQPALAWCCDDEDPPAVGTQKLAPPDGNPNLAPFLKFCSACHRSNDPFPPNFLAGNAREAMRRIAHCSERIQYRLAMWDLDTAARPKTPMPPRGFVGLDSATLAHWTSDSLTRLRHALENIAAQNAQPLPARETIRSRSYVELRRCLPTG